jgi:hypothetical protein
LAIKSIPYFTIPVFLIKEPGCTESYLQFVYIMLYPGTTWTHHVAVIGEDSRGTKSASEIQVSATLPLLGAWHLAALKYLDQVVQACLSPFSGPSHVVQSVCKQTPASLIYHREGSTDYSPAHGQGFTNYCCALY